MRANEALKINAYALGFAYRLGRLCTAGKFNLANNDEVILDIKSEDDRYKVVHMEKQKNKKERVVDGRPTPSSQANRKTCC